MPLSTRKISLVATAALGLLALAACGGSGGDGGGSFEPPESPLQKAIDSNDTETIARLVKAGRYDADGKVFDRYTWKALHYAAARGKHDALSALIEADPDADVGATMEWDSGVWLTPMHFAFHNGRNDRKESDIAVVRILLAAGADPNAPSAAADNGWYGLPLHYAAFSGNVASVAALLEAGADPNAKNSNGYTVVSEAVNVAVVRALLEAGAEPTAKDLLFIASKRPPEVRQYVLESVPDLNMKNEEGYTLLHRAARDGDAAAIAALLEAGADPNEREVIGGNTALHMIRSENRVAMIALIEGGADPNLRNNNGELPMASAELLQQAHEGEERAAEAEAERERLEAEAKLRRAEAEAEAARQRAADERRRILDENQENTWRMWCLANPSQCTTYQVIPW